MTIMEECKEYGLREPELIDADGDFRINLYRKDAIGTVDYRKSEAETDGKTVRETGGKTAANLRLTDTEKSILKVIRKNASATQDEIAKKSD